MIKKNKQREKLIKFTEDLHQRKIETESIVLWRWKERRVVRIIKADDSVRRGEARRLGFRVVVFFLFTIMTLGLAWNYKVMWAEFLTMCTLRFSLPPPAQHRPKSNVGPLAKTFLFSWISNNVFFFFFFEKESVIMLVKRNAII